MRVYGHGMAAMIEREFEVGELVARAEDSEACGFGPLVDHVCLLDGGHGIVHEPGTSHICRACHRGEP